MDAFENMLEAWINILGEFSSISEELHQACATQIFNKYVQCHLAAPDGNRRTDNVESIGMLSLINLIAYISRWTCNLFLI